MKEYKKNSYIPGRNGFSERAFYYTDSLDKQQKKIKEFELRAEIAHEIIMNKANYLNVKSREKADKNLSKILKCNNSKK